MITLANNKVKLYLWENYVETGISIISGPNFGARQLFDLQKTEERFCPLMTQLIQTRQDRISKTWCVALISLWSLHKGMHQTPDQDAKYIVHPNLKCVCSKCTKWGRMHQIMMHNSLSMQSASGLFAFHIRCILCALLGLHAAYNRCIKKSAIYWPCVEEATQYMHLMLILHISGITGHWLTE